MKKNTLITILIILGVIVLAVILLNKPSAPTTDAETAKCIGENSVLYIQLGCHACKLQEDMFGDNYQYLNKVDCFYEKDKCLNVETSNNPGIIKKFFCWVGISKCPVKTMGITATPTWIIEGESYEGVQDIEALKGLTGC